MSICVCLLIRALMNADSSSIRDCQLFNVGGRELFMRSKKQNNKGAQRRVIQK